MDYVDLIQDAIVRGDWSAVFDRAMAWARALGPVRDPRPYFALNVVHLIRGEFAAAWKTHARSLQEAEDIEKIRVWTDGMLKAHPEIAPAQLVAGLFLAQSGQSELSVNRYKEAIRLDPRAAHPHYFLAQIYERSDQDGNGDQGIS